MHRDMASLRSRVITPGEQALSGGKVPLVVLKPIPLVGDFPMLDHALGDRALVDEIERVITEAGGEISRD